LLKFSLYRYTQVSVQRHSLEALEKAAHTHELDALTEAGDGGVNVHVDHLHMGLGGDDSWTPCVHPEFLVPSGEVWRWGLTLAALSSDGDAFEVHRLLQRRTRLEFPNNTAEELRT
jgi:beta-galactosidase